MAFYQRGGHMNAAGCLLKMSAEKAQRVVLEDVRKFTRENLNV